MNLPGKHRQPNNFSVCFKSICFNCTISHVYDYHKDLSNRICNNFLLFLCLSYFPYKMRDTMYVLCRPMYKKRV